jgi:hypothetical protein
VILGGKVLAKCDKHELDKTGRRRVQRRAYLTFFLKTRRCLLGFKFKRYSYAARLQSPKTRFGLD